MPIKDNKQSNLSNLSREISLLKLGKIKKKMIGHLKCKILRVNFTGRVGPVREARKRCLRCLPTSTTASPAMLCFRRSSGSNLSSNYRRRYPWIPLRRIRQRWWNRTSDVGPMSPSSLFTSTSSRGISERKLIRSPLIYRKSPRLLSLGASSLRRRWMKSTKRSMMPLIRPSLGTGTRSPRISSFTRKSTSRSRGHGSGTR